MADLTARQKEDQERSLAEYKAALTQLWGVAIGCFGDRWVRDYGEVGEEVFLVWLASLKSTYSASSIRSMGALVLSTWPHPHPPALGQFRTELSMRTRQKPPEATKELPGPRTSPEKVRAILQAAGKALEQSGGVRDDSFLQSYNDLDLHARWGPDDPVME